MATEAKHTSLPVIDFDLFLRGTEEDRQRVADEIKKATSADTSVFYLQNHGIPEELIERVFSEAKRFFDLPLDEKNKVPVDMTLRGYTGNMKEFISVRATKADIKECFTMMLELPPDDEYLRLQGAHLYGPNKWPQNLPGFRKFVYDEYFKALTTLADRLREAFALSLHLPMSKFDSMTKKPLITLRFNHYLKRPTENDEQQLNCGVHTDNDVFTILAQDDVGGLQVKTRDGKFIDVPPVKGTFVINIGDLLERWSNGMLKAPEHRVISPAGKERYSVGYFSGADYSAVIESCMPGEIPKYPPTTAGAYFESIEVPAHLFTQTP